MQCHLLRVIWCTSLDEEDYHEPPETSMPAMRGGYRFREGTNGLSILCGRCIFYWLQIFILNDKLRLIFCTLKSIIHIYVHLKL